MRAAEVFANMCKMTAYASFIASSVFRLAGIGLVLFSVVSVLMVYQNARRKAQFPDRHDQPLSRLLDASGNFPRPTCA